MLKTIEGIYQDGQIRLTEQPQDVSDRSQVLVTILDPGQENPVKLWQLLAQLKTIEGVQQGLEELNAGQTRPIEDFVQEMQQKLERSKYEVKLPLLKKDEIGAIRVGATRVLLELVIRAFQDGATPEAIVQRYSSLVLSDVYLTIGYYLQHQDEINVYLEQREQLAESVRQRLSSIQPDLVSIRSRLQSQQQS